MNKLTDHEEREIQRSFEQGEWRSVRSRAKEMRRYQDSAMHAAQNDARINLLIPAQDLEDLQKKAREEGISYETLIADVLHQYITGSLTEKDAA